MVGQEPIIRPYVRATDDKLVLFMIGKANMECLAVANQKASFYPLSIALWVLLSSIFMQIVGLHPKPQFGALGYLVPLPAFAVCALPIIFFIDWWNRPEIESSTRKVLSSEDVVTLETYYKKTPASGFWLLEYGENFIGLVAVDAPVIKKSKKQSMTTDETSSCATIRHLYVQESYRKIAMQKDLLLFSTDHAFKNDRDLKCIRATSSQLTAYVGKALTEAGFRIVDQSKSIGILRWKISTYELTRQKWESQRSERSE